jgi:uncharacterized membrane-anchored protein
MRRIAFFVSTLLVLCACNALILQKESLKSTGQTVYLRLAPVDPRSLMMGDYMALNYDINGRISGAAKGDGCIVIALDEKKIGTYVAVYTGAPLKANERLLRYRERYAGTIQIGPPAFYFQEGKAIQYSAAKFGELRVSSDGNSLIVALCDENLVRLGSKNQP